MQTKLQVGSIFSPNILFKRRTTKLWLFRLGYLADIFLKMNMMSLLHSGKQQQHSLLKITSELSREN